MNEQAQQLAISADIDWLLKCPPLLTETALHWDVAELEYQNSRLSDQSLNTLWQARCGKLGRYFEALAEHLFKHSTRHEILACNHAIHINKRTLGELDLLVKDLKTDEVIHIELALKFYLWVPNTPSHTYGWVGSGLHDFLADKVNRLANHQLKLPVLANNLGAWPNNLPYPDRHALWMPGRLYLPTHAAETVIGQTYFGEHHDFQLNPSALRSTWHLDDNAPKHITGALHKSDWLNAHHHHAGRADIPAQFAISADQAPVYILPSHWQTEALSSIAKRLSL